MKIFGVVLLYFLLTIPIAANDFYPSDVSPANGAIFDIGVAIPIIFNVCLGHNFPAAASEWRVEIEIIDFSNNIIYSETIEGFDANGPSCFAITNAPGFTPPIKLVGFYKLQIQTFYDQEINQENDKIVSEFEVRANVDLAIVDIIVPPQNVGNLTYFAGLDFDFVIKVRNEGNILRKDFEYVVDMRTIFPGTPLVEFRSFSNKQFDIEPGAEVEIKIQPHKGIKEAINYRLNEALQMQASVNGLAFEKNLSNNFLEGNTITFIPNPIWPNEFRYGDGLSKIANNLANNDFVEFIVTDKFSDPELYSLMIYDSSGHQIDSTTLDLFTVGETVDSFTVYSYEFSGDVLPNHGAIALSYDSLRFSDYFISWGGPITAVEGIWKDSTSTDVGVTPVAGNSISLSGQGTDFSSFTWEISTPTPGSFNDSQLVPVEEQTTLVNQYRLEQNYPNPFNPATTINYSIPKQSSVTIKVFDVLGSEVAKLVNKEQPQGNYKLDFDGYNLTSGIYFYRIQAGNYVETKKMVLMK